MKRFHNTYTGYSVGCLATWAAILAVARRRLNDQAHANLRLVCMGWWTGWTSATIARIGYPPPKKLSPEGKKRLERSSLVLVAMGILNVVRLFVTEGRRGDSAPGADG
jgi:hypothetical protein